MNKIDQNETYYICMSQTCNGEHNAEKELKAYQDNQSPLDQFEIRDLISLDALNLHFSVTNVSLYITLAVLTSIVIHNIANNCGRVFSNYTSINLDAFYQTTQTVVSSQINHKNAQLFFPFIYCLFVFLLVNNLISMIPYSFASTSHFILTFSLSFTIVLGATLLGLFIHKLKFFSLFVPAGCPLGLLPLLVIIETISYLARNVSLGLRLGANMLSGHMLLSIISSFTYNIINSGFALFFLSLLPVVFIMAFSALELAISFIQAQVFVVLTCSYLKDAIVLH